MEEEEEYALICKFHRTVILGKLLQVVRQATDKEGGGSPYG